MSHSSLCDFDVLGRLGAGTFGTVYKVRRKEDGLSYVIKKVQIMDLPRSEQLAAINEVDLLSKLDHENVVRYYDSFIDTGSLCIVMEYCNRGDLMGLLKRARTKGLPSLSEGKNWTILLQILLGLHHLHSKRILHRDLKCANVFLTSLDPDDPRSFRVKLGDLGVAKLLGTSASFAKTVVGTPYYLSPELVQDEPYNAKSDMWALGVVLYECCSLRRPFEANNQCALILKIIRGVAEPLEAPHLSRDLMDLVSALLQVDHSRRPSTHDLLANPTIQRELDAYGFPLPEGVARVSEEVLLNQTQRAMGATLHAVEKPNQSPSMNSRIEYLAQPRAKGPATTHDQTSACVMQPPPLPRKSPSSGGVRETHRKGMIRGRRVRGNGQRVVSSRAVRPSHTPPRAHTAADVADDAPPPTIIRESKPTQQTPRRPAVSTTIAAASDEAVKVRPSVHDMHRATEELVKSQQEDAQQHSEEEDLYDDGSQDLRPQPLQVQEKPMSRRKMDVLGWSHVRQLDTADEPGDTDIDVNWSPTEDEGEDDEYDDEDFEEEEVGMSESMQSQQESVPDTTELIVDEVGEDKFKDMIRVAKEQGVKAMGAQDFERVYDIIRSSGVLESDDAEKIDLEWLFQHVTELCGNNAYEAHDIIMSIKAAIAAEEGLQQLSS